MKSIGLGLALLLSIHQIHTMDVPAQPVQQTTQKLSNSSGPALTLSSPAMILDDSTSSETPVTKPAVSRACQEEVRKMALAKLRSRSGQKVRLPRAELEAAQVKAALAPIVGIPKKTHKK